VVIKVILSATKLKRCIALILDADRKMFVARCFPFVTGDQRNTFTYFLGVTEQ